MTHIGFHWFDLAPLVLLLVLLVLIVYFVRRSSRRPDQHPDR